MDNTTNATDPVPSALEAYRKAWQDSMDAAKANQSKPCPSCGYCPHCGRSGHQTQPFNPWYPGYPYQPYWWERQWTYSGTTTQVNP